MLVVVKDGAMNPHRMVVVEKGTLNSTPVVVVVEEGTLDPSIMVVIEEEEGALCPPPVVEECALCLPPMVKSVFYENGAQNGQYIIHGSPQAAPTLNRNCLISPFSLCRSLTLLNLLNCNLIVSSPFFSSFFAELLWLLLWWTR
jgi:hypothetical protein